MNVKAATKISAVFASLAFPVSAALSILAGSSFNSVFLRWHGAVVCSLLVVSVVAGWRAMDEDPFVLWWLLPIGAYLAYVAYQWVQFLAVAPN
jgi:hypothetical protein